MKVVFLNPQQEMCAIQCLSSVLRRAGHRTALVNDPNLFDNSYVHHPRLAALFDETERIVESIAAENPDLVAVSVVTDDFKWALKWARRIKARLALPIVFGNVHPTYHPKEVLRQDCVDFIVRGEGELTMLELAEALGGGRDLRRVLGLGYKDGGEIRINPMRPLIEDLDVLPFPDKDLHYDRMPYLNFGYTTMSGRGCPYRCTFCDNNTSRSVHRSESGRVQKWTRRHSPEYVVREILWAKERYGIAHVRFNDEDFSYDKRWTREFCALYKEKVGVPYSAWVYPNTIDREIARLMADSGCDTVEMGVQSGSEHLRIDLLHRHTKDEQVVEAMEALDAAGIRAKVDVILGLPTETKADLDATVRLLSRIRPWNVFAFWLRYYPATEILSIVKERRLLTPEQMKELDAEERARAIADSDGPASGFWAPNVSQESPAPRYLAFIVLIPILPRAFVDFALRFDLIKLLPGFLNGFFLSNLSQILRPDPTGEFRVRGRRMLRAEGWGLLKRTLRRLLPRRLARGKTCASACCPPGGGAIL
ncbi:MAG: B12-binding domain-containing radical SAM protein [Elusimicrobia bacterium]|nr:B12-binding domain-containing radical SAM protein [Elusimicrobiota bacterium]